MSLSIDDCIDTRQIVSPKNDIIAQHLRATYGSTKIEIEGIDDEIQRI
jgi:hypothetical protein